MRHAQLKAFHAVATWGGFSRAASQLGISQPALSEQVRKLEEAYGVELFVRARRSVRLTDIGRRLYALSERQFEPRRRRSSFCRGHAGSISDS